MIEGSRKKGVVLLSTHAEHKQSTGMRWVWGAAFFGIGIILAAAVLCDGFDVQDNLEMGRPADLQGILSVPNEMGAYGALIAGILSILIGDASHLFYMLFFVWALKIFSGGFKGSIFTRITGFILCMGSAVLLCQMIMPTGFSNVDSGGVLGRFLMAPLSGFDLSPGTWILIFSLVAVLGFLLCVDLTLVRSFQLIFYLLKGCWRVLGWFFQNPGKAGAAKKSIPTEEDLQPIDSFSADLPEAAFHPEARREKFSFFSLLFRFFLPRLVWVDAPAAADAGDSGSVFPESVLPDEDALPEEGKEAAGAPVITIHTDSIPVLYPPEERAEEEDAPPPPPGKEPDCPDPQKKKKAFSPAPLQSEDVLSEEEEQEQEQEEASDAEYGDVPGSAETPETLQRPDRIIMPYSSPAFLSSAEKEEKAQTPVLRRRAHDYDEVPEDYKYPAHYTRPPIAIFKTATRSTIPNLNARLQEMALLLEDTLHNHGLEASVIEITRGPTITRFEMEPAPGMRVGRFLALVDDIALALKAHGVRVQAPIPGKGRVGIEISNEVQDPVVIRELLEHPSFTQGRQVLALTLGKDVAGVSHVADLEAMPHLLVAGATGSGKTVCIKSLLAGLLFRHTPDELQLMLIDPKMVELSIFNDIPHLITPVVTACDKAAGALGWLINEMEERYRLFADLRVRNIEMYNKSVENGEIELSGNGSEKGGSLNIVRKLPYIVCVIDELADLMQQVRAEVEDAIARLAQLARAVGIHLIVATQRPSVDVLTGVIKANFPARIAFRVSSRVDSRCILDEIGAERLIGKGDMLLQQGGNFGQMRLQGAFVSDKEMAALIAYLKLQAPPQYRDEIENYGKTKSSLHDLEDFEDPLLEDATRVVLEAGQASISMVQRRLRIGYARAARLIDMMELRGIVGPHLGSKPREILVDTSKKEEHHAG